MMPILSFFSSIYDVQARHVAMNWTTFGARCEGAKPAATKESLARWSPCEFRGGQRSNTNVMRAHGIVLDVDDGTTLEQIETAFAGTYVIAHSTFSATDIKPCWRVIVPLDEPANSSDEYERAWRWTAMKIERVGGRPEYSACSAQHPWAVPARPPCGLYTSKTIEGAFASIDEALAVVPAPEPLPEPTHADRTDSYDRRLVRAEKYLAKMPGGIQGSNGSATTFKAAVAMVRGFGLDPEDALRLLVEVHNPMCMPEWSLAELRHKIRQAWQRGRVAFGAIADRGRAA